MRHVAVRRTALVLATAFVVCAALFAWLTSGRQADLAGYPSPPAPDSAASSPATEGARLYETYCARCHPADTLRSEMPPERRRELEAFLKDHGQSSDQEDRLILDYLAVAR
jgi:mono/diheme cytochrome c family protein